MRTNLILDITGLFPNLTILKFGAVHPALRAGGPLVTYGRRPRVQGGSESAVPLFGKSTLVLLRERVRRNPHFSLCFHSYRRKTPTGRRQDGTLLPSPKPWAPWRLDQSVRCTDLETKIVFFLRA